MHFAFVEKGVCGIHTSFIVEIFRIIIARQSSHQSSYFPYQKLDTNQLDAQVCIMRRDRSYGHITFYARSGRYGERPILACD